MNRKQLEAMLFGIGRNGLFYIVLLGIIGIGIGVLGFIVKFILHLNQYLIDFLLLFNSPIIVGVIIGLFWYHVLIITLLFPELLKPV